MATGELIEPGVAVEDRAEDPRKARTRSALQTAALALFHEKPVQEISVGDIVMKAGVNRSSFYTHYSSLQTLYADALESIAIETGKVGGHSDGEDANRDAGDMPEAVRSFVAHIAANIDVYRWALGQEGSPEIVHRLRERFRIGLKQGFDHHLHGNEDADLGFGVQAAFLAGGMVGAISHWIMEEDPVPAEQFSAWLWAETRLAFAAAVERATGQPLTGA